MRKKSPTIKAIILAAGKGTRMKSDILKVAHQVAGKSIVTYVLDAVRELGVSEVFIVVGHQSELIKKITANPLVTYVEQKEQLGTGHAVIQTQEKLATKNMDAHVIVLAGDCPLIGVKTLKNLLTTHLESNADGTILTTVMDQPGSYGRILRGKTGVISGIREAKDCSAAELAIAEINTGVYCFRSVPLFDALAQISPNNNQGEYYLTDVIHLLKQEGKSIASYRTETPDEAVGVNTRMDLAKINKILYTRNNLALMQEGVTIIDPDSTFIDSTVSIGKDSIVYPFTMIEGKTKIGAACVIGPNAYIKDAVISDETVVPPFSRLGETTHANAISSLVS